MSSQDDGPGEDHNHIFRVLTLEVGLWSPKLWKLDCNFKSKMTNVIGGSLAQRKYKQQKEERNCFGGTPIIKMNQLPFNNGTPFVKLANRLVTFEEDCLTADELTQAEFYWLSRTC